jgi:hypothetical protein
MSVTIPIPIALEQRLRSDAAQKGMDMEDYIAQILEFSIGGTPLHEIGQLNEEELLERIALNVQQKELDEYHSLMQLREKEFLTEKQHERLKWLTNRIETAHAERMKYVITLAEKRGVSLEQTMVDLGLQKFAA